MADIVRWNPFSELLSFRDQMDRMFDEVMPFRPRGLNRELDLTIPINVYETGDEIVVKAYLPGIKPSDLDITVTGNVLSIRGQMREEREEQGENFFRREIQAGNFLRQVTLPTEVISDKTQATYEDGVLRLRMPKAETSLAFVESAMKCFATAP